MPGMNVWERILDKLTLPTGNQPVVVQGMPAVEDILRRNSDMTIYASAARVAAPTTAVLPDNLYTRGVKLHLDITAAANTAVTLQRIIEFFDPTGAAGAGKWVPIFTETAFAGSSVFAGLPKSKVITISPDIPTDTSNVDDIKINAALTRAWRVRMVHSDATSWTYSLGASMLI